MDSVDYEYLAANDGDMKFMTNQTMRRVFNVPD